MRVIVTRQDSPDEEGELLDWITTFGEFAGNPETIIKGIICLDDGKIIAVPLPYIRRKTRVTVGTPVRA